MFPLFCCPPLRIHSCPSAEVQSLSQNFRRKRSHGAASAGTGSFPLLIVIQGSNLSFLSDPPSSQPFLLLASLASWIRVLILCFKGSSEVGHIEVRSFEGSRNPGSCWVAGPPTVQILGLRGRELPTILSGTTAGGKVRLSPSASAFPWCGAARNLPAKSVRDVQWPRTVTVLPAPPS